MYSIIECTKMVTEQGQNVVACAKELEQLAMKSGKERSNLYERYCANQHSFNVYTYMNSTIEHLAEVQVFQRKIVLFGAVFVDTRIDYEAEVNAQQATKAYEDLAVALQELRNALQFIPH
ncbi:hypothetical protein FG382_00520 [Psychrobacillus lasiicapitis]|uniref:Uncharacterized protein n=2 Tax=Psychrobacillus lasiicapitis TaxID=1636719 RepID=A0A544TGU0_9BACI|nr:hypothetical protein FG382_00520 [Psychrobacillus lasiicapitis]